MIARAPADRDTFRAALINTLIYHFRQDGPPPHVGGCSCGWGRTVQTLGKSWPAHVADVAMECWPADPNPDGLSPAEIGELKDRREDLDADREGEGP